MGAAAVALKTYVHLHGSVVLVRREILEKYLGEILSFFLDDGSEQFYEIVFGGVYVSLCCGRRTICCT